VKYSEEQNELYSKIDRDHTMRFSAENNLGNVMWGFEICRRVVVDLPIEVLQWIVCTNYRSYIREYRRAAQEELHARLIEDMIVNVEEK
jgi:hypothetical protein